MITRRIILQTPMLLVAGARPRVLLLMGVGGPVWSGGFYDLRSALEKRGCDATVLWFEVAMTQVPGLAAAWRNSHCPIMLIGHSAGVPAAISVATTLKPMGVPIACLIAVDSVRVTPAVPNNVHRFVSVFQPAPSLGGGDPNLDANFIGEIKIVNLRNHRELHHTNIDDSALLRNIVIEEAGSLRR